MSDTTQRIADLSPQKRALLLQQLAKEKAARGRIVRRERPDPLPPSFAQQRLWLLDQLEPGSASYNVPAGAWMRGKLDLDILRRCLEELVRRHEALRTTVPSSDGRPHQVIAAQGRVELPLYHASSRAEARAIGQKEATRPFDLAKGPLMRTLVVRLSEEEHLLVFNFHHIAVDGWSFSVLYRELGALYGAFLHGRPSPLPELPIQYADFALWQREWLQGDVLKGQLDYWTERLSGNIPVLELPGDRPRPAKQSYRGDVVRVVIPAELVAAAAQRSREEGITLFMTFLAALKTLLFRYSGQTDVVVGSGIAGRNREELEPLVGYFVNTLALRTDLSGNPTFRELLARIRETTLGAYAHQDLPVERLIEELHVERSLGHSPLFQVMVFFQNMPHQKLELPGITLEPLQMDEVNSETARTDLALFVERHDDGLAILFEYSTDLFDEETVRAFGEHLVVLLRAAVANPDTKIGELPLLTDAERHTLLVSRTANAAPVPSATLSSLFEQQVARTLEATALIFPERRLTYRELDERANGFAAELQSRGAKPGELVGIYTDRGPEMAIALLGILKSGAAYLPLDPTYPPDRLAFMLSDTGARLVATQKHLRDEVPSKDVELVFVDACHPEGSEGSPGSGGARAGRSFAVSAAQDDTPRATPDDTAYVIFTSGSTGKPKGVQIPHRGAVNFLLAMLEAPGLTPADTVCAITTLSFDISVLELLLPLIIGAKAAVSDRATATDGKRLAQFIRDSGSTVVQATPASWRMLLDAGWEGVPGLKILCGGEPLPRDLADLLLARVGELWNVYGPTETTVWSVLDRVLPDQPITIGKPIRNMRMYVADANMQLVPDGVPGELLIGGLGLGHGYVNRPELTADRFIPDPFSGIEGARLYRSGDIARWRRDGRLEILGRSDGQVKLRGFRIELGEIEGALREHAAVRQVVVVLREDRPGDKRLVAYVVPHQAAPATNELRAHLRAMLPDYMIPSAFVVLEKLPISPNGKVDRRALPMPELSDINEVAAPVAPRTAEEEQLAEIWADVLGLPAVGIDDDFFVLGGHSLLATQLIARVGRTFGVDLPLRRLFEAPTVASFAAVLVTEMMSTLNALSEDELQALLGGQAP
ncbi:MAG TPA: amino acid adenylation domain-containing protein [Thermoanaerobaculia bacterium]|jgi:amino acid adenylation domain-containing protein|nr:amino acid adenylation domain-containing protein [Thermoanaerobaculia bacterium]